MEAFIMMGKQKQVEPKLFYHGVSLDRRLPQNHPLRKIDELVDFNFIRSKVDDLYGKCGNPSVDPAVILKLMFLTFYENVKSERALMSQLPLRLDWLWFCGYDIDSLTPDHSVISKARRRWGQNVFIEFFNNILSQCIEAGLVDGETIHVDSSMIDANASKDSLGCQFRIISEDLYECLESNAETALPELENRISTTDPDAKLGKKYGKTTLGYKDHRSVDDKHGIVTATVTTPANVNDEKVLVQVIEEHKANTATEAKTVAADKAYGIGENYEYLYEHNITPCIGHRIPNSNCDPAFNHDKFIYDKGCDCYICPAGKILKPVDFHKAKNSMIYRTDRKTCPQCRHFGVCTLSEKGRRIQRSIYKEYVEWADNCLTKYERKRLMSRRQYKAEGSFADAANNHGFKRMRFRGIEKAKIQNLMIAAIQNLRKLMRHTPSRSADSACNSALKMLLLAENSFNRAFLGLEKLFQPT
jgi:transposase